MKNIKRLIGKYWRRECKSRLVNFKTLPDWIWVLDPLDGTMDFIQGTKYAMHLALNYKQKPYIGIF